MVRVRQLFASARELLEAEPPGRELVRLYSAMAGDAMLRSQYPESMVLAEKSLALAETLNRPDLTVRPLQYRGWARWDARDAAGAQADLQASIEIGLQHGDAGETSIAYNNYGSLRLALEGPAAALETYREGMAFSARRGMEGNRLWSAGETTWCLYDLGRWDELLTVADEVESEAQARSWSQIGLLALPERIKVLLLRGQAAEAAALVGSTLAAAREVGDPQLLVPALEAQAMVEMALGRGPEAVDAILEIERITAETTPLVFSFAAALVAVACQAGDMALAHRLVEGNPAMPGRSKNIVITGRAVVAETEGRLDEALAGYQDAADRWAEHGSVIEHGRALLAIGRCLVGLGRAGEALEPLREARDVFAEPRATVLAAEVDDLLAETTARAG
jgi:tetratricopeptide (TPR) repeat protein